MFQYFSKANRAQRKIMKARWEIVIDDAFHQGEPGERLSDQIGRYALVACGDIPETKFDKETMRLLYNIDWVLQINKEILQTQLYAQVPDSGYHCFLRP